MVSKDRSQPLAHSLLEQHLWSEALVADCACGLTEQVLCALVGVELSEGQTRVLYDVSNAPRGQR